MVQWDRPVRWSGSLDICAVTNSLPEIFAELANTGIKRGAIRIRYTP
jgi:hypothetical protein